MVSNVAESILTILYTQAWVLAWLSSLPAFRQCADCPHGSPINTQHIWDHTHFPFSLESPLQSGADIVFMAWHLCYVMLIFFSLLQEDTFFFFFSIWTNTWTPFLEHQWPSLRVSPSMLLISLSVCLHTHICSYFYSGCISAFCILLSLILMWR